MQPPSNQTPVILISIDTLRSDHLPAYGYKNIETPAIDALRKDSVLFEHAYSNVPLTLPSHISLLTGLLPGENGVRDNVGFRLAGSIPRDWLQSNMFRGPLGWWKGLAEQQAVHPAAARVHWQAAMKLQW